MLAATLALKRALPARAARRLRRGAPTCLVLLAPAADWVDSLTAASRALFGRGVSVPYGYNPTRSRFGPRLLYFARPTPDRSGRPDASGDSLADCLASGGSAIGIAPDALLCRRSSSTRPTSRSPSRRSTAAGSRGWSAGRRAALPARGSTTPSPRR